MDKFRIHGGRPLSGSIKISGSKNSALPILAATLLTREPCTIRRVPDLSDTNYMLQILKHLGAEVELASGTVTIAAAKIDSIAPYDVVRRMRASVCVIGPLLGGARGRRQHQSVCAEIERRSGESAREIWSDGSRDRQRDDGGSAGGRNEC